MRHAWLRPRYSHDDSAERAWSSRELRMPAYSCHSRHAWLRPRCSHDDSAERARCSHELLFAFAHSCHAGLSSRCSHDDNAERAWRRPTSGRGVGTPPRHAGCARDRATTTRPSAPGRAGSSGCQHILPTRATPGQSTVQPRRQRRARAMQPRASRLAQFTHSCHVAELASTTRPSAHGAGPRFWPWHILATRATPESPRCSHDDNAERARCSHELLVSA